VNRRRPSVLLTVSVSVAAAALTGCGPKAHTAASSPAPSAKASVAASVETGGAVASDTGAGGGSTAGGSTAAGAAGAGGVRTCPGGHAAATINGKAKCLAVGQQCSAKAVAEYGQYGFVCATVNGRLVLHRK